jgi:hypothetical protein
VKFYDVFNGDADGLCALLQLRLASPRDAILVTGVKRDIKLLEQVDALRDDEIVALDVSLDANRHALLNALDNGARVSWFDHHYPGEIPVHPAFTSYIDTDPRTCSSLIVDRHLNGRFRAWAIVAAFGDNLDKTARDTAAALGLEYTDTELLRELGVCLNYNAYGELVDDLLYPPADLFGLLKPFTDPREFIRECGVFESLQHRMRDDLQLAQAVPVEQIGPASAYAVLPEASWSRRVVGVYANGLAQRNPQRAHAVLVSRAGGHLVSIRAPLANPTGAAEIARAFKSGGGREGAAGIDFLPESETVRFLDAMRQYD